MTPQQANEVLRATAEHVISRAEFIYGIANASQAVALIKEALIVNQADSASGRAQRTNDNEGDDER